ncbi:hypothetical protein N431DRAFT_59808 [Stipitochalara longipes BDJ]|nr:hypothetical protein N431DRAFT_59808 [Stipitochalara longipes BDJ]
MIMKILQRLSLKFLLVQQQAQAQAHARTKHYQVKQRDTAARIELHRSTHLSVLKSFRQLIQCPSIRESQTHQAYHPETPILSTLKTPYSCPPESFITVLP